jgi:hypothetical protein
VARLDRENDYDYIAVGLDCSDRFLEPIQHAVSYHPNDFPMFRERRAKAGGNLDYITHSNVNGKIRGNTIPVDRLWPLVAKHPFSGSSSYLGAQVAVGLGYQKVILCGCPMLGPNLLIPKASSYDVFQKGWIKYSHLLQGKVRSMSGWTREFLQAPTEDWLNSDE